MTDQINPPSKLAKPKRKTPFIQKHPKAVRITQPSIRGKHHDQTMINSRLNSRTPDSDYHNKRKFRNKVDTIKFLHT